MMPQARFEDELNRFEAEIRGNRGQPHFGGSNQSFLTGGNQMALLQHRPPPSRPPFSEPSVLSGQRPLSTITSAPKTYAAAPQLTTQRKQDVAAAAAAAAGAATGQQGKPSEDNDDDDQDILAKLMKYESEVKKDSKKAKKGEKNAFKPSSVTNQEIKKQQKAPVNVLPVIPNLQIPLSTKQRLGVAGSTTTDSSQPSAPGTSVAAAAATASTSEEPPFKRGKKQKRVIRTAGGQMWEDDSLKDWDLNDFRLFCGDLGNDVTDEVLARTFGRYPSFVRAKVVRDKRTNKTKGYGFASFRDPADFTKAMKEINGKYVGSRPIKLRKSNWKDRNVDVVKHKQKLKQQMGYKY